MPFGLSQELIYVILLFALFVLPRFLQRLRIPTPITCIVLGMVSGMGFDLFTDDATVRLLASFGIITLFLFAGLDINFHEVRQEGAILIQHIVLMLVGLLAAAWLINHILHLSFRPAVLVALALLTPSTGFILESLNSLAVTQQERFWIRSLAIGAEVVALGVFFLALQTVSVRQFVISLLVLIALIGLVPLIFRVFARSVVPYAPKSEFAFLLMVAVVSAYVTRELGVYYLVGAFVVGIAAQQFRERLPSLVSENMLHAVEVFASFFIPFYFFSAGLHIHRGDIGGWAALYAAIFLIVLIPLRLAVVAFHRRIVLGETWHRTFRIGIAIMPTLVFSLVIVEILRDRFAISSGLFGGIILYTLVNTILPSFVFRLPVQELDTAKAVSEPGVQLPLNNGPKSNASELAQPAPNNPD
jgi:Kef-type K+ transport system membrane component KefB